MATATAAADPPAGAGLSEASSSRRAWTGSAERSSSGTRTESTLCDGPHARAGDQQVALELRRQRQRMAVRLDGQVPRRAGRDPQLPGEHADVIAGGEHVRV